MSTIINYMTIPGINRSLVIAIPTMEKVELCVCSVCGITLQEIKSGSRKRAIVFARQFIMYISRTVCRLKLMDIANYLNMDHTTIMHGVRAINNWMDTDENVRKKYIQIIDKINF